MTVGEWLAKGEGYLASRAVPEPAPNAQFLMAEALGLGRGEALRRGREVLQDKPARHYWNLVLERGRRVPLAYVVGWQSFMGLRLEVREDVLIPRPETEELVAEAARLLDAVPRRPRHVLEIGTGTGCIAIALASRFADVSVVATELSPRALALALRNAETHGVSRRIRLVREDLFKPGAGPKGWAELVISNPPYVSTGDLAGLEPEVLAEPRLALDGGQDGLDALRAIIATAPGHLKPGGLLVLEIGSGQGPAVRGLLERAGLGDIAVRKDFAGHDRVALGRRKTAGMG